MTGLPRDRRASSLLALPGVRRALAIAALGVAASATLYWVAGRQADAMRQQVQRLRAERDEHRARLERDGGVASVERFQRLRSQGLFATGDAIAWVEALTGAVSELGLPAPRFEVAAREPAAEGQDDAQSYFTQRMRFAVDGLHEEEFLRLLAGFARRAPGSFAIRECRLTRAAERGLTVECTLRWLVFEPPQADTAAAAAPAQGTRG